MRVARLQALIVVLALASIAAGAAFTQPFFPSLTGRVNDQARIIDPVARSRLESKLEQLETKTTNQLVIVTLQSLQGYDIADYGYRLGRQWGIGQGGKDNGALLIVAPNERRVRIEVGYGLEGTLTDAISRLIIENAILPRFRVGDFAGGIERGIDDLIQVLSGDAEDFKERAARQRDRPSGAEGTGSLLFVILLLIVFYIIFVRGSRQRGYVGRRPMPMWIPMGTGGGLSRCTWSGGSSSSGDFSGGGGSFGGGGASGSW